MEYVHNYHIWNMFTIIIYGICSQSPYMNMFTIIIYGICSQLSYMEYVRNYYIRCQYRFVLLCQSEVLKLYLVQSLFKDFSV